METVLTITAKGQVTFRKALLRHLGVRPGDKLSVELLPDGQAQLRSAKSPETIDGFIGCLQRPDTPMRSIEEIGELAAQGWASR